MSIADNVLAEVLGGWRELVEQARSCVVDEQWAPRRAQWEHPEPLLDEREGRQPVHKPYAKRPARPSTAVRYGVDAEGSIVTAERYVSDAPRPLSHSSAWVRIQSRRVFVSLSGEDSERPVAPVWVKVPVIENGILTGVDARWHGIDYRADLQEHYVYSAGALTEIRRWERDPEDQTEIRWMITRDDDGQVAVITSRVLRAGSDQTTEVYRRERPGGYSAALRSARSALPERIAAWAGHHAPRQGIVALALLYDADIPNVLPALALLSEADRVGLLRDSPDDQAEIWNPTRWTRFDPDPREFQDDQALIAAATTLKTHWGPDRLDDERRKLLNDVAHDLATRQWGRLAGPAGVVVFATDGEQADLEANAAMTVPADVRARFQRDVDV